MHLGLWLDKPYTSRRSGTLKQSATKTPSLLLSVFLVIERPHLMPSRVLEEFSETTIYFSIITGTGTVPLFLWKSSVYTLSCPIMCEPPEIYSDVLQWLLFHYFFWFGQAAIPAWKFPVGNPPSTHPFLLQLTNQSTVCIVSAQQRLWWNTQDLWCKSVSVEKCKIPCSREFRRNEIRGSFSPYS